MKFREDLPEVYASFHVTESLYFPADILLVLHNVTLRGIEVCPSQMGIKQDDFILGMDRPTALLTDHECQPRRH